MVAMAYLSLYRKYRPQTVAEILGQDHVSGTLTNAINEDRVAHAYLFTGPRGTGKTSTARILAKALNCVTGPTPNPCGVCNACVAITEGSSLDVIEMDAASHSKVDETRDILAGVPLATAGGRKKVYVIDEVHMLSSQAFNALLKTLEEPPPHVLFVLATTEAHKVLPTIVSRTQRFDFRRVPASILEEHLAGIAKLEGIDIASEAVSVMARHADGGVRDALSALDQLSSMSGHVTETDAEALFGGRHEDSYLELFDAIASGDVGAVFVTMHSLATQGADSRQLALGVLSHARSLLLMRTAPDAEGLLEMASEDVPALKTQAERFAPEGLLRVVDLIGKALTEMRNAPNHRLLLEVALVRAAAPDTDPSALGLMGRIERLERRIGIAEDAAPPSRTRQTAGSTPPPQQAPQGRTAERTAPAKRQTAPVARPPQAAPQPPATPVSVSETLPTETEPATPGPVVATPAGMGLSHIKDSWVATMGELRKASVRVHAFMHSSRPVAFEEETLTVEVQAQWHADEMTLVANRQALAEALHSALGIRPTLVFIARGAAEPVVQPTDDQQDYTDSTEVAGSELDPLELVKKGFGAEVVEERTSR
jgi:DNA polymerase-3 subunit gamma/tau